MQREEKELKQEKTGFEFEGNEIETLLHDVC
jgi:hypothetical protein